MSPEAAARRLAKERQRRKELGLTQKKRGYGNEHAKLRRRWARVVRAGQGVCARCGYPIEPDEPWDLGHDDHDRELYLGPEHRRCNRRAGGKKSAMMRARRLYSSEDRAWSREWF